MATDTDKCAAEPTGWWLTETDAPKRPGETVRHAIWGECAVPEGLRGWTPTREGVVAWVVDGRLPGRETPETAPVARQDMAVPICEGCACGWQRVYLHTKCAFVHLHDGQESPCNSPAFGVVPQE